MERGCTKICNRIGNVIKSLWAFLDKNGSNLKGSVRDVQGSVRDSPRPKPLTES